MIELTDTRYPDTMNVVHGGRLTIEDEPCVTAKDVAKTIVEAQKTQERFRSLNKRWSSAPTVPFAPKYNKYAERNIAVLSQYGISVDDVCAEVKAMGGEIYD